jgi:DNA-binding NtrC family response regulator
VSINYAKIKYWVYRHYGSWEHSEDIIQEICLAILEGRKSDWRFIAIDYLRKLPNYHMLTKDPTDFDGITEDDIIFDIDLNRPILRYMEFKPTNRTKTTKNIACASVDIRGLKTGMRLRDIEQVIILETIRACGGNKTHAAKILGISIRGLRIKLSEINVLRNNLN